MEVCSGYYLKGKHNRNSHSEIVYEGKSCPLCEALENIEELENDVKILNDEIDRLNSKFTDLEDKCLEFAPEVLI